MSTVSGVWYRSEPSKWFEGGVLSYQDRGTLEISPAGMRFDGRKETLVISGVRAVRYGRQGMDYVSNWVLVEYGSAAEERSAYFADGRWFGWRGLLGGTRRLYEALAAAAPARDDVFPNGLDG